MGGGSGLQDTASRWVFMEEPEDGEAILWVAKLKFCADGVGSMSCTQLGSKEQEGLKVPEESATMAGEPSRGGVEACVLDSGDGGTKI